MAPIVTMPRTNGSHDRWAAVVFAAVLLYFWACRSFGIYLEDEGTLLYQFARTAAGQLPYRDFHTGYTPAFFYVHAAIFRLCGFDVLAVRTALAVVNAATVGLLFVLARRVASRPVALAVALAYAAFLPCFPGRFASFNIPYPSWYVSAAWLLVIYALDRYGGGGRSRFLWLAGAAVGAAFSLKPNAGLLAAAGTFVFLAGWPRWHDGSSRPGCLPDGLAAALQALVAPVIWVALGMPRTIDAAAVLVPVAAVTGTAIVRWWRWRGRQASRIVGVRFVEIVWLTGGFAAVTLPWILYVGWRIGHRTLLAEVLLIGGHFQEVYGLRQPPPTPWSGALVVVLLGVAMAGRLVARGALPLAWTVIGGGGAAVVGGAVLAGTALAPEGIVWSLIWQIENAAFYFAPTLHLVLAGWVARDLFRAGPRPFDAPERVRFLYLASAVFMYIQLVPRVDFMHLIMAVPATLLCAALALEATWRAWQENFARAGAARAWATAGLVLPVFLVIGVRLVPNLPVFAGVRLVDGQRTRVVPRTLPWDRAPVWVNAGAAGDLLDLAAAAEHLTRSTTVREPVFYFPAMTLAAFLTDRPNPTRHDYYYPGRPDHGEEAEVIATLARTRPRFALVLRERLDFFSQSPAYFFLLRRYIQQHYRRSAAFGRFHVFVRRDVGEGPMAKPLAGETREAPHVLTDAAAIGALTDAEPPVRDETATPFAAGPPVTAFRALVQALQGARPEIRQTAVRTLLHLADRHGGLEALVRRFGLDPAGQMLLIRAMGNAGDARAFPYLVTTYRGESDRLRAAAAQALYLIVVRLEYERYDFDRFPVRRKTERAWDIGAPAAVIAGWLAHADAPQELRVYAAAALAATGDVQWAALLAEQLAHHHLTGLQAEAAAALVRLGVWESLCAAADLLQRPAPDFQNLLPSLLLEVAEEDGGRPDAVEACLGRLLRSGSAVGQEVAAWIAAALGTPAGLRADLEAAAASGPAVARAVRWARAGR